MFTELADHCRNCEDTNQGREELGPERNDFGTFRIKPLRHRRDETSYRRSRRRGTASQQRYHVPVEIAAPPDHVETSEDKSGPPTEEVALCVGADVEP